MHFLIKIVSVTKCGHAELNAGTVHQCLLSPLSSTDARVHQYCGHSLSLLAPCSLCL